MEIDFFPKWLTHAFGQKMASFPIFFLGNFSQESVFYDILEQKNAFQGYKNKKFQKSKNWHSSKKVNAWFWSKNGHFSNFFFSIQYRPGKCLLWYSTTEKRLSRLSKQEVQKVEKLTFFKGINRWFWSKNGHFSNFFFSGNISQENVLYDILDEKNAF